PRDPSAGPAGARPTDCAGTGIDGYPGYRGPGGRADLRPGTSVVCADWRHPPARPNASGLVSILLLTGGIADRTGAWGTVLQADTAHGCANTSPGGPRSARGHLVHAGRIRRCPDVSGAGDRPHRPGGAAGHGAPPWRGACGAVPCLCGEHAVVSGLSGAGHAAESGGPDAGPGIGPSP